MRGCHYFPHGPSPPLLPVLQLLRLALNSFSPPRPSHTYPLPIFSADGSDHDRSDHAEDTSNVSDSGACCEDPLTAAIPKHGDDDSSHHNPMGFQPPPVPLQQQQVEPGSKDRVADSRRRSAIAVTPTRSPLPQSSMPSCGTALCKGASPTEERTSPMEAADDLIIASADATAVVFGRSRPLRYWARRIRNFLLSLSELRSVRQRDEEALETLLLTSSPVSATGRSVSSGGTAGTVAASAVLSPAWCGDTSVAAEGLREEGSSEQTS